MSNWSPSSLKIRHLERFAKTQPESLGIGEAVTILRRLVFGSLLLSSPGSRFSALDGENRISRFIFQQWDHQGVAGG